MCAPVNMDRIGDNMATSSTFDADKLRATSEQLRDAAAVYAGRVAVRAADLANQGVDWAAPRAQAALTSAIEHAAPAIENAAARAQAAAAHAGPAIENAREHLVEDYLPRASLTIGESTVADALVALGFEKGKTAARRTISSGGASINNVKVEDPEAILRDEDVLAGGLALIRKGRKNLAVLELS